MQGRIAVGLFIVIAVVFYSIVNIFKECEPRLNTVGDIHITPNRTKSKNNATDVNETHKRAQPLHLQENVADEHAHGSSKRTNYLHLPYHVQRDPTFNYKKEIEKLNKERVRPDDPRLVNLIRNFYIEPPSDKPYKLIEPWRRDSSYGQAAFVDGTLGNMEEGFFVDSGAHDGEIQSNTLFFEKIRGWTGILIEPQPNIYQQLKRKNRKSFTINACISVVPYPSTVKFLPTSFYGKMVENIKSEQEWFDKGYKEITVQCFPLYSILLAMNQLSIDYFSLDVEGAEEGIINNIPLDKVKIRAISIEYDKFEGGADRLRNVMERKGFQWLVTMNSPAAHDCIFYK